MSKKKKRKERLATQSAEETIEVDDAEESEAPPKPPAGITPRQKLLAVVGFGLCGFLAAFLTGANLSPDPPAGLQGLARASWEAAALGSQALDLAGGVKLGVGGLILGGSLGYSLFLAPLFFVLSWLGGALGFYLLFHVAGNHFVAGTVGWFLFSVPFMVARGKLKPRT